jgi:hypothetical protein
MKAARLRGVTPTALARDILYAILATPDRDMLIEIRLMEAAQRHVSIVDTSNVVSFPPPAKPKPSKKIDVFSHNIFSPQLRGRVG